MWVGGVGGRGEGWGRGQWVVVVGGGHRVRLGVVTIFSAGKDKIWNGNKYILSMANVSVSQYALLLFFMANIALAARFREKNWNGMLLHLWSQIWINIWFGICLYNLVKGLVLSFTLSSGDKGVIAAALIGIEWLWQSLANRRYFCKFLSWQ